MRIVHQSNGSSITGSDPAVTGEIMVVYVAGLGATIPDVSFGATAPSSPPAATSITPQVTLETRL